MTRVKDADAKDLLPAAPYIADPVVVVFGDGKSVKFLIYPMQIDPFMSKPTLFGIVVSDLIDQIANCYAQHTKCDAKALSDQILQTVRREHKYKDKDPTRGNMTGASYVIGGEKKDAN
jgi:hypothetical protein